MQISRLFKIVYSLLQNGEGVTARELAERFEVSRRTIYRDVEALSLAGIPVYAEKGRGGGIRIMEGFTLKSSLLSDREQSEILSSLQGLSAIKAGEAEDVLHKLGALFHKNAVIWLEVDFSDWSFQNGDQFKLFKEAILQRKVVEFYYYGASGEKTRRRVEPVQLWFKHRAWYVRGFCLGKGGARMFRLSRVKELRLTGEAFSPRAPVFEEPAQEEGMPKEKPLALKLKIAPERAYRAFDEFSMEQLIKNDDGSYTVSVLWPEDNWVYGFILSFGEYMEVLEPAHVKETVKQMLEKTLSNYL